MQNIIDIIQKHSLTVRCLPYETVTYWSYREGDETRTYVGDNPDKVKREVVIQDFDLEYFEKTDKQPKWTNNSPLKRYEMWKKNFPNGRKLLKETRIVEKGGWWCVKETKNTSSIVQFDINHDKFFAPTLEEAITLYLNSIK